MDNLKLDDEAGRLEALHRYEILDTPAEEHFDKITRLIKVLFEVPMSAINLIDDTRRWSKSSVGLEKQQIARDISFCTHTIKSQEPLVISDTRENIKFSENPLVLGPPYIASYAGIPLQTPDGYNIGAICVMDTKPREFDDKQIEALRVFASIVVDEIELRKLSQVDELTGALSRRGFLAEIAGAISLFSRHNRPSTLVMFDIDHFKHVNDTHGHAAGDAVLRAIGARFSRLARPSDAFGRLGGEEFAMLLSDTDIDNSMLASERFRQTLEEMVIMQDPLLHVTASFGLSQLDSDCQTPESWLAKADAALYRAKRGGRNRCCV
jgi:diguanylate cyclase (GGDEF)-like protein